MRIDGRPTPVTRRLNVLGFLTLLMLLIGCSGNGNVANGIVRFSDGQPVQSGSVEFRSLQDGARYASRIATDGTFTLTAANGEAACPPGDYEVVVVQIVWTEDLAAAAHEHGRTVPRRYADYYTSGLRATQKEDRTEPLVILLEPDGD